MATLRPPVSPGSNRERQPTLAPSGARHLAYGDCRFRWQPTSSHQAPQSVMPTPSGPASNWQWPNRHLPTLESGPIQPHQMPVPPCLLSVREPAPDALLPTSESGGQTEQVPGGAAAPSSAVRTLWQRSSEHWTLDKLNSLAHDPHSKCTGRLVVLDLSSGSFRLW